MNETTATDELIAEYGEWLKRESSVRNVGEWREVTLPFLDRSNDDLCFYVRTTDGSHLVHRRRVHDGVLRPQRRHHHRIETRAHQSSRPAFRRHGRR